VTREGCAAEGRIAAVGAAAAVLAVTNTARFPLTVHPVCGGPASRLTAARDRATRTRRRGFEWARARRRLRLRVPADRAQPSRSCNGYSGFFPPAYMDLYALLKRAADPGRHSGRRWDGWTPVLVVYHLHDTRGFKVIAYAGRGPTRRSRRAASRSRARSRTRAVLDVALLPAGSPLRARALAGSPETPARGARRVRCGRRPRCAATSDGSRRPSA
jgi:hypothetical protein